MDVSFKTYETKFSTLAPLVDGYKFVLLKKVQDNDTVEVQLL